MREIMLVCLSFASCFHLCNEAQAQPTNAFDFFKSLKGSWNIQSGNRALPIKMTYDLASKDTIVTESFGKELSVFYPDGNDLMMTHFCNAGNHPRLKLKKTSSSTLFEFEMVDITNLNASRDGAHVQRITYTLMEPDKLDLKIVWKRGEKEESENYVLTRARSPH